jgi:hypothetical protein
VWLDRHGVASTDDLAAAQDAGVHVIRGLAELPGVLA